MSKSKPSKKGGGGGGGGSSKGSSDKSSKENAKDSPQPFFNLKYTLGGLTAAMLLQLALTNGYLSGLGFPGPRRPAAAGAGSSSSMKAPQKPPTPSQPTHCPEDWSARDGCPQIGVDWVGLEALEKSAEVAPTKEALEACHSPHTLLSPRPVKGMHLVCVLPPPAELPESSGFKGDLSTAIGATVAVFREMDAASAKRNGPAAIVLVPRKMRKATHVVDLLKRKLRIQRPKHPSGRPLYQPPALFNEMGVKLVTALPLIGEPGVGGLGRVVLMEGGQWIWPPVDVGFSRVIPGLVSPDTSTRVETLSLRPLVVEVEDFLTPSEAGHIVNRAKPHMAKSGVALKDADKGKAAKEFRTSSQYFLPTTRDSVLERIDRRVSMLTRIPISHAEYIQVLRYNHMEHYSSHHDFFDPAAYAGNPEMLQSVENGAKNRLATVFFYLNNVTAEADVSKGGGQTNFPRAITKEYPNGGPQPRDYFDCSKGLSVFPQEGKVIIFYSMQADGSMDDFSLHGGCDVLDASASKWSANFWLWNKPYHFVDAARKRVTQEMEEQAL